MKKLIIAAAIVCAAAFAQAAMVDWTIATGSGSTYYVFNGDYSTAVVTALSDTTDGGSAAFNEWIGTISSDLYKSGTTGNKGASGQFTKDAAATLTYLVMPSGLKDEEAYKIYTASTSGMTYDPEAQQSSPGKVKFTYASQGTAGTIAAASVPEPTSAMFLLLGVAGLALRRRRA